MPEVFSVSIQVDEPWPSDRHIHPNGVWFDTIEEAQAAVRRALELPFDADVVTVMVSRELVEQFDHEEDPDLDDWPAERHILGARA